MASANAIFGGSVALAWSKGSALVLHSSDEPDELWRLYHDDSAVNIVVAITITIIRLS